MGWPMFSGKNGQLIVAEPQFLQRCEWPKCEVAVGATAETVEESYECSIRHGEIQVRHCLRVAEHESRYLPNIFAVVGHGVDVGAIAEFAIEAPAGKFRKPC